MVYFFTLHQSPWRSILLFIICGRKNTLKFALSLTAAWYTPSSPLAAFSSNTLPSLLSFGSSDPSSTSVSLLQLIISPLTLLRSGLLVRLRSLSSPPLKNCLDISHFLTIVLGRGSVPTFFKGGKSTSPPNSNQKINPSSLKKTEDFKRPQQLPSIFTPQSLTFHYIDIMLFSSFSNLVSFHFFYIYFKTIQDRFWLGSHLLWLL